ncbi:DUF952 domain-containing protein [Leptolyngbya sp. 7M]|uniref:DUF952 domain-containing protein n=1 Tax=Leptolyngbya sp. 7M TaxID=2812896 RepID=UPI001B8A9049|nr:DUF952 domain-containing protein [Leptolyngbya sp. 7M]QYO65983.1 DUF952 domain-containing protein [Leptolyngbya sp. 7M]
MLVYHIVLKEDLERQLGAPSFVAGSLETEGFIHCSFQDQIDAVLRRYFNGYAKVMVLTIETDHLTSRLIEEPSTGGEIYPHIYGPIDRAAIVSVEERRLIASR